MLLYIAAWICLVLSLLLAIVCHPAIFFGGRPTPMPMGAFDDLFYWGQWLALALAIAAAVMFEASARRPLTIAATLLVVYLIVTGVPHQANRHQWYAGKLGVLEFVRAVVNPPPQ